MIMKKKNGINKVTSPDLSAKSVRHRWTEEEDELLLSFKGSNSELADMLNVSVKAVNGRKRRLADPNFKKSQSAVKKPTKSVKSAKRVVVTTTIGTAVPVKAVVKKYPKVSITNICILDLKLGDVFKLPNGQSYICNSLAEPEVFEGKIHFEFIGKNTVRYMCIIPENFGFAKKEHGKKYSDSELESLNCTLLFNVWDTIKQ